MRKINELKLEWSMFLNQFGRRTYNELCRNCQYNCKQSYRTIVIECQKYQSKRMLNQTKLIRLSNVAVQEAKWLWYPYLPAGNITMLQGDPGEGKTMLILTVTALLSNGLPLPQQDTEKESMTVIYQTVEYGIEDTIKPRLEKAEADCTRVVVIDDSDNPFFIDKI